jgi:hypothetical protein
MAAVLDVGLLEYFSIIFPALLVFVIVYALFEKLKILGENKALHAIAAIAIAFMLMLSRDIMNVINFIAPWFVLLFIFVIMLLVVYKTLGATDQNLADFITTHTLTQWIIIIIGFVIVIAGIANVYGERAKTLTTGDNVTTITTVDGVEGATFGETVGKTFFHPKIIGIIFIFLVAAFSIGLLTQEAK